jgi:hypothetical protein
MTNDEKAEILDRIRLLSASYLADGQACESELFEGVFPAYCEQWNCLLNEVGALINSLRVLNKNGLISDKILSQVESGTHQRLSKCDEQTKPISMDSDGLIYWLLEDGIALDYKTSEA